VKVLITGGAGFVGVHLAGALVDGGADVTLADNFARGVQDATFQQLLARSGVRAQEADLLSPGFAGAVDRDFDAIFHLAAIIGVRHVLERPYDVLADNAAMTVHAIEAGRCQRALQRVVFSSTSEIYAGSLVHLPSMAVPTPETTPIALTDLSAPRTSYMLSKAFGEALFHHSGLPATSVRLHNIYGPRMGMSHVIPELLHKAWRASDGDELTVANLGHRRTFCYVADAVRMLVAILGAPATSGEVLNIGNSSPEVTIGEVAETVVSVVGRRMSVVAGPDTPGSPARRCPDVSRLTALTGVVGTTSLADGIRATFEWYREHAFTGDGPVAR
jgi:nucleoside-diphosphate-sugar epimerase